MENKEMMGDQEPEPVCENEVVRSMPRLKKSPQVVSCVSPAGQPREYARVITFVFGVGQQPYFGSGGRGPLGGGPGHGGN